MRCFFDIESTSRSVYDAEIIEGYFLLENGENYHFKSKVDQWSESAAEIHKIRYSDTLNYPDKIDAYRSLCKWVQSKSITQFVVYANQNQIDGFYTYDLAVIKMQLFYLTGNHTIYYKYFNDKPLSVHTLARECARDNLFAPIKRRSETGKLVQSLTQENVYAALLQGEYNAHSCVDDVLAMKKIHDRLIKISNDNMLLI